MVSGPRFQLQKSSSVTPIRWRKVRRRECPDKIWISWWGVFVSCRIFALSILLKNYFVIDDAEFSFSHFSLHCCLRKLWIGSLAFDQQILEFLICVLGFSAAARASWSAISFPAIPLCPGTQWKLTEYDFVTWKASFWILAMIGMVFFLDPRAWSDDFESEKLETLDPVGSSLMVILRAV